MSNERRHLSGICQQIDMSLFELPASLFRKISSTISGVRQQAPAARMVGEFAVKHVANEANKKITEVTKPHHNDQPPTHQ